MVTVTFYGRLAESIGRKTEVDIATPCTVAELRAELERAFPASGVADRRVRACVEGEIVDDSHQVPAGAAVEVLAPVSGG